MRRLSPRDSHRPGGARQAQEPPARHLFDGLAARAQAAPEQIAIDCDGQRTSYHELHEGALALAGYLEQHLGVRRGDRVLLLMPDSPRFVIAYYAVLRCDAVVVLADARLADAPEALAGCAAASGGRVLIAAREQLEKARPLLDADRLEGCIVGAASGAAGGPLPHHPALHDFEGALAAGIAPTPMHGGGGDLAVLAYAPGPEGQFRETALCHRDLARAAAPSDDEPLAAMHRMNQALRAGRTLALSARAGTR